MPCIELEQRRWFEAALEGPRGSARTRQYFAAWPVTLESKSSTARPSTQTELTAWNL